MFTRILLINCHDYQDYFTPLKEIVQNNASLQKKKKKKDNHDNINIAET